MTTRQDALDEFLDLVKEGAALLKQTADDGAALSILDYQKWYSRALTTVKMVAPDRYEEFRRFYEPDPKRKNLGYGSYVIQDYVKGVAPNSYQYPDFDVLREVTNCLSNQVVLLVGVGSRLNSVLSRLQEEMQAELSDAELDSARELTKVSVRAAGALAGVVLEAHLAKVCGHHGIRLRKKTPAIGDYNDALKDAGVYATPTWRKISYMADVRNTCSHKKDVDPTRDQVVELIDGTAWTSKNVL